MVDFSNQYNSNLNKEELLAYNEWLKQQSTNLNRDLNKDLYDYDIQGWWKENKNVDLSGAHLTDKFKKPNHPTFSNQSQFHGKDGLEGGTWNKLSDGSYTFTPNRTNLEWWKKEELQNYFSKVEPNNKLIFGE